MNVLWLQSGGCGGCTLSWLGSEQGPLFRLLADEGIDILWHPSLSEACLDDARELIARCADGRERVDVLCIEGSLLRGPRGSGGFHRFGGGA
jgi:Ni,Fe-hydrogenase I small subunit